MFNGKNLPPDPMLWCHTGALLGCAAVREDGHADSEQGVSERPVAAFPESLFKTSSLSLKRLFVQSHEQLVE